MKKMKKLHIRNIEQIIILSRCITAHSVCRDHFREKPSVIDAIYLTRQHYKLKLKWSLGQVGLKLSTHVWLPSFVSCLNKNRLQNIFLLVLNIRSYVNNKDITNTVSPANKNLPKMEEKWSLWTANIHLGAFNWGCFINKRALKICHYLLCDLYKLVAGVLRFGCR